MGKGWFEASAAARATFAEADATLGDLPGGARLSDLCFAGPADVLNRTDVSQPALYTVGVACFRALAERAEATGGSITLRAAAGLSLGEYTALHLAGCMSFADGLRLVALRGRLMQAAAEASEGGMVALIGGDEAQAQAVCDAAAKGEVLVSANFNAPGQIVLSGHRAACQRAVEAAGALGLRATPLQVAGAFHSPLMAPAAEGLAQALERVACKSLSTDVWSNVTAEPHVRDNVGSIKKRLVEQLVSPVRWSQSCAHMLTTLRSTAGAGPSNGSSAAAELPKMLEMAPGVVLKGLMRRIDRACEVLPHDQPA